MEPKVTITLLTYNQEDYVGDALMGILNQTYKEIEVIILDDASTDSTTKIIEDFIPKLKRKYGYVNFIKHKDNSGNIPSNCNEMMRLSTGKYIKDCAGDDMLLPNCIITLVNELEKHPEADVVHANCFIENDYYHYGDEYSWKPYFNRSWEGFETDKFFEKEIIGNHICAPSAMLRRDIFFKYGYFDENIKYEDYEMWLRIAKSGGKFFYTNKFVAVYRRSSKSITNFEDDAETKLLTYIQADFDAKRKYLDFVDESVRYRVYKYYYVKVMEEIKKQNSNKGLALLEKLIPQDILNLLRDDYLSIEKEKQKKEQILVSNNQEIIVLNNWLKNYINVKDNIEIYKERRLAIYGYGRIGNNLLTQMKEWKQYPEYIIDKRADELYCDVNIYKPTDDLPPVDVVISTLMTGYHNVKESMESKLGVPVLNLMDMIYRTN